MQSSIETFTWKVTGLSPLIQSNPCGMWKAPEAEEEGVTVSKGRKKTLRGNDAADFKTAAGQLYVNETGLHYHPAISFEKALMYAALGRKIGKSAAPDLLMASITIIGEEFLLYDPDTLDKATPAPLATKEKWQLDYRRGVNHNSKPAVCVVTMRPKWRRWGGILQMEIETAHYADAAAVVTELLNIAGHHFGIGVGRRRIVSVDRWNKATWSGFGAGKFSVEMV